MMLPYVDKVLSMAEYTGPAFSFTREPSEVTRKTTTVIINRGRQAEFFDRPERWVHCRFVELAIDLDDLVVRQLQSMPNLEYLSLEVMNPGDRLDLSASTKLLYFNLSLLSSGCKFSDISLPVSTVQACIKTTKKRTSIADIKTIGAPNLQRLCLYGSDHARNIIDSLDPVLHWQKLRFLDLLNTDVAVKDLKVLNRLPELEKLRVLPKLRWVKTAFQQLKQKDFDLVEN